MVLRATLVGVALTVLSMPAAAAARSYAPCRSADGSGIVLRYKPRSCTLGGRFHYQQAPLVKLRWRSWHSGNAHGRGRFIYNMGFNEPATVTLYRRQRYEEDTYVFSRARVCVHGHGCHAMRLPV